jgi:hypothetical protein
MGGDRSWLYGCMGMAAICIRRCPVQSAPAALAEQTWVPVFIDGSYILAVYLVFLQKAPPCSTSRSVFERKFSDRGNAFQLHSWPAIRYPQILRRGVGCSGFLKKKQLSQLLRYANASFGVRATIWELFRLRSLRSITVYSAASQ